MFIAFRKKTDLIIHFVFISLSINSIQLQSKVIKIIYFNAALKKIKAHVVFILPLKNSEAQTIEIKQKPNSSTFQKYYN
tara:strand:+ start:165 stop:401 length:237 start_codon:yes stop_codon:yes gene_type:complete